jgi:conjugative transfer signal peptidase TraF
MRTSSVHRAPLVAATLLAAVGLGIPMVARPLPRLVYNASASAPLGFYRLIPDAPVARGDLVLAHLPPSAARLAADRRYLPLSVPVVKRVAALARDLVCASAGVLTINNRVAARALRTDSEGRSLPAWHGCRPLDAGEVFLLMTNVPASFDGRYFGPIPATAIIGRLVPLWTW